MQTGLMQEARNLTVERAEELLDTVDGLTDSQRRGFIEGVQGGSATACMAVVTLARRGSVPKRG